MTIQTGFPDEQLTPALDAALAGQGHVYFVDAAHFVYGTFLCCLWSFRRLFVRAASGRQRFNVPGASNAITRELVSVTNTTVVNTETMCELLRKIAGLKLAGPVTLVLDNARYQRNAVVTGLAGQLGIRLMFLPSYSPNLAPHWTLSFSDCGNSRNAERSMVAAIPPSRTSRRPSNRLSLRSPDNTHLNWHRS